MHLVISILHLNLLDKGNILFVTRLESLNFHKVIKRKIDALQLKMIEKTIKSYPEITLTAS